MIDLTKEGPPIPLSQVPSLPEVPRRPDGKKVHIATIYRWEKPGINGVQLEVLKCGGTKCTTVAAIHRFFQRLTEASQPDNQPRTRRQQRSDVAQAEAELDRAGITGESRGRARGRRPGVGV